MSSLNIPEDGHTPKASMSCSEAGQIKQTTQNTIGGVCIVIKMSKMSQVVYHLPKNSGNFGWDVNGKTVLVCPNGNFPK